MIVDVDTEALRTVTERLRDRRHQLEVALLRVASAGREVAADTAHAAHAALLGGQAHAAAGALDDTVRMVVGAATEVLAAHGRVVADLASVAAYVEAIEGAALTVPAAADT